MKTTFSYPKWAEIPNIDLYLDQVLLYVNQVCAPINPDKDKGLTASMVNNYVKHGYLTKPDKKKYQRQQICTFDCYHNPQVCIFYSRNSTDTEYSTNSSKFRPTLRCFCGLHEPRN